MPNEVIRTNQAQTPAVGSVELLKDTLKRCSAETVDAAIAFRKTGDLDLVPTVVLGIVERFLDPDVAEKLHSGDDTVRFMEDLGLDSLTMIEAIMMVEESLGVSIKNEELIDLRTLGDLKAFISRKIAGVEEEEKAKSYSVEQIAAVMPQQDPFLFLQSAEVLGSKASGTYEITGQEVFLAGHFKDNPVFPASIMLEALGQLGVFHFLETIAEKDVNYSIYFTGVDGVRCHRVCRPGETLELSVELKRTREPMNIYSGKISVKGEKVVSAEEITLVFADESLESESPDQSSHSASGTEQ